MCLLGKIWVLREAFPKNKVSARFRQFPSFRGAEGKPPAPLLRARGARSNPAAGALVCDEAAGTTPPMRVARAHFPVALMRYFQQESAKIHRKPERLAKASLRVYSRGLRPGWEHRPLPRRAKQSAASPWRPPGPAAAWCLGTPIVKYALPSGT